MNARIHDIAARRHALVAKAAGQRGEIAAQAAALGQSLAFADLAWRSYRRLKSNSVAVAVIAVALVAIGPGRLLRVGYRSALLVTGLLRLIKRFRTPR